MNSRAQPGLLARLVLPGLERWNLPDPEGRHIAEAVVEIALLLGRQPMFTQHADNRTRVWRARGELHRREEHAAGVREGLAIVHAVSPSDHAEQLLERGAVFTVGKQGVEADGCPFAIDPGAIGEKVVKNLESGDVDAVLVVHGYCSSRAIRTGPKA